MSLTDLLKRISRPAVFGLALAVSPVYSCGGEEAATGCQKDSDCKGSGVCVENACEEAYANSGDSGSEEGPCGNSPLNGKYLWEVGDCESGPVGKGNTEQCTYQLENRFCPGVLAPKPDEYECAVGEYDSTTISFYPPENDSFLQRILTLHRGFSCIDISPSDQGWCDEYTCALQKDEKLYVLSENGVMSLRLWQLHDTPQDYLQYCGGKADTAPFQECFPDGHRH